ncbi:MAG: DUF1269 domain-containing protein [Acidimicrobiales bacterium]
MSTSPNLSLHVLAFDDPLRARELLLACVRMQRDGAIGLTDAVFVHRDAGTGKVRVEETTDPTPGATAAEGAFMGVILGTLLLGPIGGLAIGAIAAGGGALAAKLIDLGVPESFLKGVVDAVAPGSTALVLQTSHMDAAAWQEELARFPDARPLSAGLPADARARLGEGFRAHEDVEVVGRPPA